VWIANKWGKGIKVVRIGWGGGHLSVAKGVKGLWRKKTGRFCLWFKR